MEQIMLNKTKKYIRIQCSTAASTIMTNNFSYIILDDNNNNNTFLCDKYKIFKVDLFCGAPSENIGSTSTNLHYCASNTTTNNNIINYYYKQTNINKCM